MDEVVIRKLDEIVKWIEGTLDKSKSIHELKTFPDDGNFFIAVSNGVDTGKVRYKPSEVTKSEFENLRNMQLGSDSSSNTIFIEDAHGNILTSVSLNLLTGDFIRYTEQFLSPEQQKQARLNIDAVGSADLENSIPKKTSDLINDGANGIDKFATVKDIQGKTYQFSAMEIVPITHGLGRYVDVTVIIGTEKVLADVHYEDDLNTIIVKFKKPETGLVLIN